MGMICTKIQRRNTLHHQNQQVGEEATCDKTTGDEKIKILLISSSVSLLIIIYDQKYSSQLQITQMMKFMKSTEILKKMKHKSLTTLIMNLNFA